MGRRSRTRRKNPIPTRVLRAAGRAALQQDEELATIAQNVYAVGKDVKETGGVGIPLAVYAPFRVAAELWSIVVVRRFEVADALGVTEEEARRDVADYFTAWLIEMGTDFRVDLFIEWRERMLGLERRSEDGSSDDDGASEPTESPTGERRAAGRGSDQEGPAGGAADDRAGA